MSRQNDNPFKNLKLDKEEEEITKAIENNEFVEEKDLSKKKRLFKSYASFTLAKQKNINIRISLKDLQKLKIKAAENGLPYQTLASTILHHYSNNKARVQI